MRESAIHRKFTIYIVTRHFLKKICNRVKSMDQLELDFFSLCLLKVTFCGKGL